MSDRSTLTQTADLIRVSLELGPWHSPEDPGWQAAYDDVLGTGDGAADAPQVYAVVEPGLAPAPLEDRLGGADATGVGATGAQGEGEGWLESYVAHAALVMARYGDKVAAFEILPQPETTADRAPLVSPAWMARALTMLQAAAREAGPEDQDPDAVRLVACIPAGPQGGAGYIETMYAAGRDSYGWTEGDTPLGGVSVRLLLDLTAPPSSDPAKQALAELTDALERAEGPTGEPKPVFISGFVLSGPGEVGDALVVDTALAATVRAIAADPRAHLAVKGTPEMGPGALPESGEPGRNEPGFDPAPTWALFGTTVVEPPRSGPAAEPPAVDGFDFPCWKDAADPWQDYKIDSVLCDAGYFKIFKGVWHPGEDWNGKGGGDSDLGDPVYAIAHGLVVIAQFYASSWGNIVLVRHSLPDGTAVWSQYAHLDAMHVTAGEVVLRGQQVGTLGKGAPKAKMLAHLHFEIRLTDLPADNWFPMVRDKAQVLANYAAPKEFIAARRPGQMPAADAISVIIDEAGQGFRKADVPHWMAVGAGYGGGAWYTFGSRTAEANVATWSAALPEPGKYQVAAFVPRVHATTQNAVYTVTHRGGKATARVDQARYHDQWVPLGVFAFGTKGEVRLTDLTGEAGGLRREVAFDAVRWLKVG